VNNLCCSGEEKIIRTSLQNIKGIEDIAVNIVGRYAVVKHCPVPCCASPDRIVEILNEKYLGASIQELAEGEGEEEVESHIWVAMHVILVTVLFIIGLVCEFIESLETVANWVYIVSVIIGIWPILYSTTIAMFVRHTIDIHVLMVIAIIGSLIAGDFFDASLVVALFLCAEVLEQIVFANVRQAVKLTSAGTIPKHANLADGSKVETGMIKKNMVICVRAGEMILTDGVIVKGEAVVDEAALSGECVPIHKAVGDEVRSGTIVHNGFVEVRASKGAAQSTLQRLRQEVQDVQADRGQYAKMVDQFALYWTPLVLVAATVYILAVGFSEKEWAEAGYRGMLILVLACPCSIVISAPIPAICAIANAAKHGVLIRGSSVVEKMAVVDTVALDKTGTLTKGFFKVTGRLALTSVRFNALSVLRRIFRLRVRLSSFNEPLIFYQYASAMCSGRGGGGYCDGLRGRGGGEEHASSG
jgi:Cd2+/Zn2+-exporting ATPase